MNAAQEVERARLLLAGDPLSQLLGYQILERLRNQVVALRAAQANEADAVEAALPRGYQIIPVARWTETY